jgi:hypothetical protein
VHEVAPAAEYSPAAQPAHTADRKAPASGP